MRKNNFINYGKDQFRFWDGFILG